MKNSVISVLYNYEWEVWKTTVLTAQDKTDGTKKRTRKKTTAPNKLSSASEHSIIGRKHVPFPPEIDDTEHQHFSVQHLLQNGPRNCNS